MSKTIYIVVEIETSLNGYEPFEKLSKAFTNRQNAENYIKELASKYTFEPEFKKAYENCVNKLPEWEECPYSFLKQYEHYKEWFDKHNEEELELFVKLMSEEGFQVSKDRIELYQENYNYEHSFEIRELDLEE